MKIVSYGTPLKGFGDQLQVIAVEETSTAFRKTPNEASMAAKL